MKPKPEKFDAIHALVGGGISEGNNIIKYHDGQTPPSEEEIDTKLIELKAEWTAQEYARNRKKEYPPMEDQLDKIYHDGVDRWKNEMIQPVKDKYPKPE